MKQGKRGQKVMQWQFLQHSTLFSLAVTFTIRICEKRDSWQMELIADLEKSEFDHIFWIAVTQKELFLVVCHHVCRFTLWVWKSNASCGWNKWDEDSCRDRLINLGVDEAREPEPFPPVCSHPIPHHLYTQVHTSFPDFHKGGFKLLSMIFGAFCYIPSATLLVHLSLSLCQPQNVALNIFFSFMFLLMNFLLLEFTPLTPLCPFKSYSLPSAQVRLFSEAFLDLFSKVSFTAVSVLSVLFCQCL